MLRVASKRIFRNLAKNPKFIFSELQKPNETEVEKKYNYNEKQMAAINDNNFIKRMKKMQENEVVYEYDWSRLVFPALVCAGAAFIYHLWSVAPYNVIFKHATISEYINQKYYYHSIFLGSISLQNQGHFLLYFPTMVYSTICCSIFWNSRTAFLAFILNSIVCTGVTYLYEKKLRENKVSNLLVPKCNGGVTSLFFNFALFALHPERKIFKVKALPFFIIPATYLMYEYWEFKQGEINELCRPAHFAAILNGFLFGLFFRLRILPRIRNN